MTLGVWLLIILFVLLIGALPTWQHSRSWGYIPAAGLGVCVAILLALFVMRKI